MPRTIDIVTSSRADWCHLEAPLRAMRAHPALDPHLLVTGAHLSPEFGMTVRDIERAGFDAAERIECLLSADTDVAMARTIGLATISFAEVLGRRRPDLLLVIADRYEMLAPASAALALRIPIIHIEGGERSEGAIDQAVSDALTKMSHVHLTTTERARATVVEMGEEPWRVHRVGAGSLDHLRAAPLLERSELEHRLGVALGEPPVIVTLHPLTLARDTTCEADAVFAALETPGGFDEPIVFTFPNADAGGRALVDRARRFCAARPRAHLFTNLEPRVYWSLLRHARFMLGNSSSGVMESPSLGLPAIDVGERQRGRERAPSVMHVDADRGAILTASARARDAAARSGGDVPGAENLYGDGRTGPRIAEIVASLPDTATLLAKRDPRTHTARDPG